MLQHLHTRNPVLYWYGWLNLLGAGICIVLIFTTSTQVLGINAWIKPLKFYLSVATLSWTMAWLLVHLDAKKAVKIYSWVLILVLTFEHLIITWQAARGKLSHFNIETPRDAMLFMAMGIAITIFTLWTLYIGVLFFRQREFSISASYVWGIRLGIILFVIFAFEGGMMASRLAHTIGAADGGSGLPLLNWSRRHGDLRVAHFLGIHSLQILPFIGYLLNTSRKSIVLVSLVYAAIVSFMLFRALEGLPLWR